MNTTRFVHFIAAGFLALAAFPVRPAEPALPAVTIPPADQLLQSLKAGHPRLLATADDFTKLKQRVKTNSLYKSWVAELHDNVDRILRDPPSRYEIPDGLRLLGVSRRVLYRMQILGLLYQLEGDKRYSTRAWRELEAAANFKDWNPRHFLDTAEMTHAFAIGYDWMYGAWTPAERKTLRNAIVEKGLKLALGCYDGTARYGSWWKVRHNWNQVCNGGISMGALAIADEEPALAGEFLHRSLQSLQLPMAEFGPDGAWNEGPGYWNYATTYNFAILAALQTALGTDFGLSQIPGFAEAGMFPIHATGPFGRTFNYADAGDGTIRAPHMFWMAQHLQRPVYAAYQRPLVSPHPLDLIWYDEQVEKASLAALPLDKYFRRAEVATFRSVWDDREAVFVGFKAGDNKANHSNLDLGSFVLDALGVRWALDLGADNYNLPGYFGDKRWTYYRLRAEGHNTIVINPGTTPDQDPKAATRISRFDSKPQRAFAIADLTPAYAKQATNVQRGIALLDRRQVLVQDEMQAAEPATLWWFMHTRGQPKIARDGSSALLTDGKARLWARILSPAKAEFTVLDAKPLATSPRPEQQALNDKARKLAIRVQDTKDVRLAVLLVPLREGEPVPATLPSVQPLAQW